MIVRFMDVLQAWMALARQRRRAGRPPGSHGRPARVLGRLAGMLSLHNRPLMLRLTVLLLPPTLVATAFGVLRVSDARAQEAPLALAARYAAVSRAAVLAAENLEDERDTAARAVGGGRERLGLDAAYATSDRDLAALDTAASGIQDQQLVFSRDDLRLRLRGLDELRRVGFTGALPATTTVRRYSAIILAVIHLGRQADEHASRLTGDSPAVGSTSGVFDLLIAAGLNSQRRALGTALLERGSAARGERGSLTGFAVLVDVQTATFRSVADPTTLSLFQAAGVEQAAGDVDLLAQRVAGEDAGDVAAATWIETTTLYLQKARQVIWAVVDRHGAAITAAQAARADETRRTVALILAVIVVAVLMAAAVGWGMAADLRRVRDRMRRIAEDRLPRALSALRDAPVGARVPPAGSGGTRTGRPADEIGEVEQAFEDVHARAMRLAAEQARMRITMAGVARTLTGRTQELIARQLGLITELEQRQIEPAALDRLFRLDHLATRIRRHSDNLLVLSGAGPGWRWPRPATLSDVVQAAAAATEQYARVEVAQLPDVDIVAGAVVDVIQILAELADNAARFSPPEQPVRVTGGLLNDAGVRVEVRDSGYGLGTRTAATLNARLADPSIDDLGDEPTLGLHVVALLAARTGIAVHLVPHERGCSATVVIPRRLISARPPTVPAPTTRSPGSGDRPGEWVGERLGDRSGERLGDRSGERLGDRSGERLGDRLGDRSGERLGDRPGERLDDRAGERMGDRLGDWPGDRSVPAVPVARPTPVSRPGPPPPAPATSAEPAASTGSAMSVPSASSAASAEPTVPGAAGGDGAPGRTETREVYSTVR